MLIEQHQTGAGISTSAGIPDFRSPDKGLYANLARLNLPYPEAVFNITFFRNNPQPFYALALELYPGKYRPTIAHSFVRLLSDKHLLLKLFTQNIDCLEREAGVPGELIVEAHGSFASHSCIECKSPYPDELMKKAVQNKEVPHCQTPQCNGLVKPNIVFFGEQLPDSFFQNRTLPAAADLCIIMGTSLSVHPFASLPGFCAEGTPRLLINLESVGDIGSRPDDVLLLGDCDAGVRKLASALGWLEDLEALWEKTNLDKYKDQPQLSQPKKSKDEVLEDEIEKLTAEVDQSLKLSNNHHSWLKEHLTEKHIKGPPIKNSADDKMTSSGQERIDAESEKRKPGVNGGEVSGGPEENDSVQVEGDLGHIYPHLEKKPSL